MFSNLIHFLPLTPDCRTRLSPTPPPPPTSLWPGPSRPPRPPPSLTRGRGSSSSSARCPRVIRQTTGNPPWVFTSPRPPTARSPASSLEASTPSVPRRTSTPRPRVRPRLPAPTPRRWIMVCGMSPSRLGGRTSVATTTLELDSYARCALAPKSFIVLNSDSYCTSPPIPCRPFVPVNIIASFVMLCHNVA